MFKPREKTYLLLAGNSLSLAVFAFCYPYAESIGMDYLGLESHPVIRMMLSVFSLFGLLGFVGFFIWFIVSLVQDWWHDKKGIIPERKDVVDIVKMTPEQITAYYEGLAKLKVYRKTTKR